MEQFWIDMATDVVLSKVRSAIEFRKSQDIIAKNHEWLETVVGDVFWAPTLEPFGINVFIRRSGRKAVATVTKEPRGGLCLFRLTDKPLLKDPGTRIDFRRLKASDTTFIHPKGFMCNVAAGCSKAKIDELLLSAVTGIMTFIPGGPP